MYDLIIRDATIVSSHGRLVADVAVKDGLFAYVGPRPPRRAKRELSAIGKFLMPGVIDTAAQIAPDGDADRWAIESAAAVSGGITTMIGLPSGTHPLIDGASAQARLKAIASKSWVDHAFWGLATASNRDAIAAALTEGHLIATLAMLGSDDDCIHPDILASFVNLPGAIGVQVLDLANIEVQARSGDVTNSPELTAVLQAAREHTSAVHWVNLSTAAELDLLDPVRGDVPVTAGVTPHHLFLSVDEQPNLQTRPPLRSEQDRRTLWTAVRRGRIDCLASDHHAVGPGNKGAPSAELMLPLLLGAVRGGRLSLEQLVGLCSEAPARILGLPNKGRVEKGAIADLVLFDEAELVRIAPDKLLSSAGWTPYEGRDIAPKPDLVMVNGEVVSVRGEIATDKPTGRHLTAG